jgi:hypothetical protein
VQHVDARHAAAVRVDEVGREARDEAGHRGAGQFRAGLDAVLPGLDRDRSVAVLQVLNAGVPDRRDQIRLRDVGARERGGAGR